MINLLRNQCTEFFPVFSRALWLFEKREIRGIYDPLQYKVWGKNEKAFVGELLCGSSCFIMKYLLEDLGHTNIKVICNSRRSEYGIEDHVFLDINNIIVDPTYRQFLVDGRSKALHCFYRDTLFNKIPSTMINDQKGVEKQLKNLININKSQYKTPFVTYDEIKEYWTYETDVTHRYNLHQYMEDETLLKNKPKNYVDLVSYLN